MGAENSNLNRDSEKGASAYDIAERTQQYSVEMIKFYKELIRDSAGRVIGNQLLRSATSIGANVHEAQGAQSKADFISKLSIAHKEARETLYWLKVIEKAKLLHFQGYPRLYDQTQQLIKILSSSLLTAKTNRVSEEIHSSFFSLNY